MRNGKNKHVSMFSSAESLNAFLVKNMEQNYFSMSWCQVCVIII